MDIYGQSGFVSQPQNFDFSPHYNIDKDACAPPRIERFFLSENLTGI
jgi:hypothetical protein